MKEKINKIADILSDRDNFLVVSHENPDGDAIGSMAAMGHLLKAVDKSFSLFNRSPLPDKFAWLDMPAPLFSRYRPGQHSWIIVLDCGNLERVGLDRGTVLKEPVINMDHHVGNPEFGSINWVDPSYSSVGEMVADLADHMGVSLQGAMAQAIYLALVSDTGFFSFGNTTARALELSARLIRNGIRPGPLNAKILKQWTPQRMLLHGMAMQKAEFHLGGKIGIIMVTRQMLDQAGADPEDCEGLVNMVRNVKSVEVAISLREEKPGRIKFSLRSSADLDVQKMAAELDGGGHKNASGGKIEGPMDPARDTILEIASRHLTWTEN